MNISQRGAVIATAMLAGTLGLASFVVMSSPAARHRRPAPVVATRDLGSATRATQVRPAGVATPSSPAPSPPPSRPLSPVPLPRRGPLRL